MALAGPLVATLHTALLAGAPISDHPAAYAPLLGARRCIGDYSAHSRVRGFEVTAGGLTVSFCNATAWTFRDLNCTWPDGQTERVLTPTGFAQVMLRQCSFLFIV